MALPLIACMSVLAACHHDSNSAHPSSNTTPPPPATTTLTASVSELALSVTGMTEYGVAGTPSSGEARIITVTNTGGTAAANITVADPLWPSGTSSSNTCPSVLPAGASCTITVTPGGTPSRSAGLAATPDTLSISADNANTVTVGVVILTYANIYQGGYLFFLNDSTPDTGSVGGRVVTTTDQAPPYPNGIVWASDGAGNAAFDAVYGIAETSLVSSPAPGSGEGAGQTACNGAIDGACDTGNIDIYYTNDAAIAPVNPTSYAAGLCKAEIAGYSDWYLPAICELGYDASSASSGCGTAAAPSLQNLASSLVDYDGLRMLSGSYWSATEFSTNPANMAWAENYASGSNIQSALVKNNLAGVRCVRALNR